MTDRELMQQALYAFEWNYNTDLDNIPACEQWAKLLKTNIAALRERLAQPEQEPLEYWNAVEGWVKIDEVRQHFDSVGCGTIYKTAGEDRVPVYTTPPQRPWVGLTEPERLSCYDLNPARFASNIEAKLQSKNT